MKRLGAIPFAGACTDPCDGRTQGTTGMFDSLPYRNDASMVLRRLIRSLPTRRGVIGVATCDKGLPAMMMALAATHDLPAVLVPGGVTLLAEHGEDAGRFKRSARALPTAQITLEEAAEAGCRACATPGGGCQFLGTAATSQVVAEALGLSLPHSALAPSGQPIWLDMAARSARALLAHARARGSEDARHLDRRRRSAMRWSLHAAFGGSTNLLLHMPAIAFHAGLKRPTVDDWAAVKKQVPRLVDALPNGPRGFATVQVFLAGGVPEVMLHLRRMGLLATGARTVTGETLDTVLDWWEQTRAPPHTSETVAGTATASIPDDVIMSPDRARESRLDLHRLFSARQPCSRKARSSRAHPSTQASSMRTACIANADRRAFSRPSMPPSRPSRQSGSKTAT